MTFTIIYLYLLIKILKKIHENQNSLYFSKLQKTNSFSFLLHDAIDLSAAERRETKIS